MSRGGRGGGGFGGRGGGTSAFSLIIHIFLNDIQGVAADGVGSSSGIWVHRTRFLVRPLRSYVSGVLVPTVPRFPPFSEMGSFMHAVEDEMLCQSLMPDKVPYFNAPIYLQNKSVIGRVDEILGPINEVYFSVKMGEGMVASSFKKGDKVYIGGDKLLPIERFLPKPKLVGTCPCFCFVRRYAQSFLNRRQKAPRGRWSGRARRKRAWGSRRLPRPGSTKGWRSRCTEGIQQRWWRWWTGRTKGARFRRRFRRRRRPGWLPRPWIITCICAGVLYESVYYLCFFPSLDCLAYGVRHPKSVEHTVYAHRAR